MNTSRLPTAVRKLATEPAYQPKISVWPIQPTTTSSEPMVAQRRGGASAGPQRTITSKANATSAAATGQRRISTGRLQLPETSPAQITAIAASSEQRKTTASPTESGKRTHQGRGSLVS